MSSIISKVCFYVPAVFHLVHGSYMFGDPLGLFGIFAGIDDPNQIGAYIGGDQYLPSLTTSQRLVGFTEVVAGLGIFYLGDSRMGHLLMAFFGVLSAVDDPHAYPDSAAGLEALNEKHRQGFETGVLALGVVAALSILGLAVTPAKKSEVQRRSSFLSTVLLFLFMLINSFAGLAILVKPLESQRLMYSHLNVDLKSASPTLGLILLYQWKMVGAALLVVGIVIGTVKPARFALFLVMICDAMGAFTMFEMIPGFPSAKDNLEIGMMACGGTIAICFITLFTLPSASKKKTKTA